jgi:hypothetical protein
VHPYFASLYHEQEVGEATTAAVVVVAAAVVAVVG